MNFKEKIIQLKKSNPFLWYILIFGLILRIILLFTVGNLFDIPEIYYAGQLILDLKNPYLVDYPYYWATNKLPPMFFYFFALGVLIFGDTIFAVKIGLIISDLLIIFYLYKIASEFWDEKNATITLFFYIFSPISIFFLMYALTDLFLVFTLTATTYYFFKQKYGVAGFFMAIGISYKVIPILMCASIVLFLLYFPLKKWKKSKSATLFLTNLKKLLLFLSITIGVNFVLALPFLIEDFNSFFSSVINVSRQSGGMSFEATVPFLKTIGFQLFSSLYISLNLILFIIILLILIIFIVLQSSTPTYSDFLILNSIIILLSLLIFLSFNPRIYCWINPFLCLILAKKTSSNLIEKDIKYFQEKLKVFGLFSICLFVIYFIYLSITFNVFIWSNPNSMLDFNWAIHPENRQKTKLYGISELVVLFTYFMGYLLYLNKGHLNSEISFIKIMEYLGITLPFFFYFVVDLDFQYIGSYTGINLILTYLFVFLGLGIFIVFLIYLIRNYNQIDRRKMDFII